MRTDGAADRPGAGRVLLIAHRGDSLAAPENTLPALLAAVEAGADVVELDYRHTLDGVPVVVHDETLERTTNAAALWGEPHPRVDEHTLAELRTLDAGSWFDPRFAGTKIPTLAEALAALVAIREGVRIMVERKAGDAATCTSLVRRAGLADRVQVHSLDWRFLAECRALAPDVVLGALGDGPMQADRIEKAAALGAAVVGWNDSYFSTAAVEEIHRRGLQAWAWTVDDPSRGAELASWGIDGLITNAPRRMRRRMEGPE